MMARAARRRPLRCPTVPAEMTAAEAAELVRDTDRMGIPLGPGHPAALLHALGERERFDDLVVAGALLTDLYPLFTRPGVRYRSGFFGPAERFLRDMGADIEFVPADFRRFKPVAEAFSPRIFATSAAMPDSGYVSLSLHAGATIAELHRAGADPDRLLVVEVNEQLPVTFGLPPEHPHRLALDEIDVLVVGDRDPIVIVDPPPGPTELAIAEHAEAFISSGCTLQTGIGAVPNQIATALSEGSGGDYGVHSEMFTNGLMHLHRAGKVTNRKGIFDGFSVCTFAAGTLELYEWLHENAEVRFLPVEVVNSPDNIAANRKFVSINSALAVDLWGQVTADTRAGRQYSGIGGHEDFLAGAGLELEDRSLLCLPSTVTVDGELRSRIVPAFAAGTVITAPRHQLDVVVTEYGAAEVQGLTVRERAARLAEVAHPDFRDELLAVAETLDR
jgi:acyl-CoA hydrolase